MTFKKRRIKKRNRKPFKRKGNFSVYMVQCRDGTFYTGSTGDLEKRIALHNKGNGAKYLRGKLPVKLVYARQYRYYKHVLLAERKLKTYLRSEKQALIEMYEKEIRISLEKNAENPVLNSQS